MFQTNKIISEFLYFHQTASKDYGYRPKYQRAETIHQVLFYLLYDYKGKERKKREAMVGAMAEGQTKTGSTEKTIPKDKTGHKKKKGPKEKTGSKETQGESNEDQNVSSAFTADPSEMPSTSAAVVNMEINPEEVSTASHENQGIDSIKFQIRRKILSEGQTKTGSTEKTTPKDKTGPKKKKGPKEKSSSKETLGESIVDQNVSSASTADPNEMPSTSAVVINMEVNPEEVSMSSHENQGIDSIKSQIRRKILTKKDNEPFVLPMEKTLSVSKDSQQVVNSSMHCDVVMYVSTPQGSLQTVGYSLQGEGMENVSATTVNQQAMEISVLDEGVMEKSATADYQLTMDSSIQGEGMEKYVSNSW